MSDHYPVMLNEVVSALNPQDGEVYVDGTFGAGGYTSAFLKQADCTVIAIDRDPSAVATAQKLSEEFGKRFVFLRGCFGDALALLKNAGYKKIDGFVLDIGVSSMQIDQAARGFSFRFDGPLDMRMDTNEGATAADMVNEMDEEDLANVIYRYGEEHASRRIARFIVAARAESKIETTSALADIVRKAIPRSPKDKIDPATKTFQALRIAVNDELGELERGLDAAEKLLKDDGRLAVVSFHSLEDSIVKNFLMERSGHQSNNSRHMPALVAAEKLPTFTLKKRKAISAGEKELDENVRSRSAKLRVAIRNDNQSWNNNEKAA